MSATKPRLASYATRLTPSLRLSFLAFALSSWFEGYAQLRQSVTTSTTSALFDTSFFSFTISLNDLDAATDRDRAEGRDEHRLGIMNSLLGWLKRRGRRMDETERSIMGSLDVVTSLALLHFLRPGPLFPFLFTPLLTSIPLPAPTESVQTLRWRKMLVYSLTLCLLREAVRGVVAKGVAYQRSRRDERDGVYTGKNVIVRGAALPQAPKPSMSRPGDSEDLSWMYASEDEDDENEVSCMICSANTDLSQSMASVSSQASRSSARTNYYGPRYSSRASGEVDPLEAFCSVAPTKHVAHRGCIMRWHATFNESQRPHIPPIVLRPFGGNDTLSSDSVRVVEAGARPLTELPSGERVEEATRRLRKAQTLLKLAGFNYLLDLLRVTPNSISSPMSPVRSPVTASMQLPNNPLSASTTTPTARPPFIPTFTLASTSTSSRPSGSSPSPALRPLFLPSIRDSMPTPAIALPPYHLATLRTEWPPCPGCRSPIDLHFCALPAAAPSSDADSISGRTQPFPSVSSAFWNPHITPFLARISALLRQGWFSATSSDLVTGRTIALSLSAQLSFILTISSMMHARERMSKALEALEREIRAKRVDKEVS